MLAKIVYIFVTLVIFNFSKQLRYNFFVKSSNLFLVIDVEFAQLYSFAVAESPNLFFYIRKRMLTNLFLSINLTSNRSVLDAMMDVKLAGIELYFLKIRCFSRIDVVVRGDVFSVKCR